MGAIFKKRKENPYARISSKVAGKNRVEKNHTNWSHKKSYKKWKSVGILQKKSMNVETYSAIPSRHYTGTAAPNTIAQKGTERTWVWDHAHSSYRKTVHIQNWSSALRNIAQALQRVINQREQKLDIHHRTTKKNMVTLITKKTGREYNLRTS